METLEQQLDDLRLHQVQDCLADIERIMENKYNTQKPNLALIDQYTAEKERLEAAREIAAHFDSVLRKAEQENIDLLSDPFQQLHVKTNVERLLGAEHGALEVGVEFRHGPWEKVVPPEHKAAWDARRKELERLDLNRVPRPTIEANFKSVR